jgi:flagellar protein FlgJ
MFAQSAREAQSFDGYSIKQEQRLKEVCQDFEAMFIDQIYKTMRKATMQSDLIKKNAGEQFFTEMLDTEMSRKAAAESKGGLGDMLFEQMKKYIPSSKDGNNFHEEKKTDLTTPYNSINTQIKDKKSSGINLAI